MPCRLPPSTFPPHPRNPIFTRVDVPCEDDLPGWGGKVQRGGAGRKGSEDVRLRVARGGQRPAAGLPRRHPAGEVGVVDALLDQPRNGARRPAPAAADDRERAVVGDRQAVQGRRQITERDVHGVGGMPGVPLVPLADVEDDGIVGQVHGVALGYVAHGPILANYYLRNLLVLRSASGLPPVWQVAQYCSEESANDTSRTMSPHVGQT